MSDHKVTVFCPGCGECLEDVSQKLSDLQTSYASLGVELTKKQQTIARLRKVQSDDYPAEYDLAMGVAEYWRELLAPKARELNGPRLLNTIQRIRAGYPAEELRKSIWGYYCRPNILKGKRVRHDQGGDRRVDLELIMRDGTHVDVGLEIAEQEVRFDQGVLNEGGSKFVAGRCDCGHARGDHGLFRINNHEACHINDCQCNQFDDSEWHMDQWSKERELRAKRLDERSLTERVKAYDSFDPSPVDLPSQGSLL